MKIAIHQNKKVFDHSTLWTDAWAEYCRNNKIDFDLVDCFENNTIEKLKKYDVLLWHFSNYSFQEMLFARNILYCAKNLGLKTFPDFESSWHFDDKIAEESLLKTTNAPKPESWMFFTLNDAINWIEERTEFPVIAKLRCGSGSMNVKMIKNRSQAISYSKKMFSNGFNPSPNPLFKISSNVKSSKNWSDIVKRFKRIPDFLSSLKGAKLFPNEKGYVYFQEFIPNDGFDLKIVTVGNKLSYICRNIRKNDFRASGGGSLFFDKSFVSRNVIDSAFRTSDQLGFKCMGYDYVVDKRDGIGKIIEISYGFSHKAVLMANGYWDREMNWHDEGLNAPVEILKNIFSEV